MNNAHIIDAKFTKVLPFVLLEDACAFKKVPIRVICIVTPSLGHSLSL